MKHLTGVLFLLSLSSIYLSWKYFWMQIGWQSVTTLVVLAGIWFIARLKPQHKG